MRIGFDVTALCTPVSGVGIYTRNLLDQLERMSLDDIRPLAHRELAANGEGENWSGITFGPDRRVKLNKTVWMQALLPWQLARLGTDICHFTNGVGSLWTPCPSVVTIHDMTVWLFPQYHYRRRQLAMRPFVPLAARRAAAVIAVSQATKDDVVRVLGVDPDKVHVVHEAASSRFQPVEDPAELDRVRKSYRLPPRLILHVGTIEPRKNLARLLEALARLRSRDRMDYALVLVGRPGWKHESAFEAVERLNLQDAVRLLGYVPTADLISLYSLADVVAFPSLYEGFGLPVLEAMACGTPVVTSAAGSLPEVAGDAAEFVDPRSVQSIAAGLRRVLGDRARWEELRARGLERARAFGWDQAARETREIYAGVRAAGSAPSFGADGRRRV
jgi:glycosyltransferase involved in cell wall biosynthesis